MVGSVFGEFNCWTALDPNVPNKNSWTEEDLSPFGFLLFFPKRKKGAGTLYEIPAPFLNSENEKSTYLLVSKTSGQVPLSCYEFFSTEKRCPFCFYISKRAPCFFRKRIGSNPYSS